MTMNNLEKRPATGKRHRKDIKAVNSNPKLKPELRKKFQVGGCCELPLLFAQTDMLFCSKLFCINDENVIKRVSLTFLAVPKQKQVHIYL